jgi:hypothetical protein
VLWALIRFVLRRTFGDPVREGRLRDTGWPAGLRAVVVVGLLIYLATMLSAVFASLLRRSDRLMFSPPDQTLPAMTLPLLCLAMIMSLTCLFTGALHLVIPLRLAFAVIVISVVLNRVNWTQMESVDWGTLAIAALLAGTVAVRWRATFHWLEFVWTLILIGSAVVGHQVVRLAPLKLFAPDIQLTDLGVLTNAAWALAVPVAALAGAALVEITTSSVTWTVSGVWRGVVVQRRRAPTWGLALLIMLAAGRGVQVVWRLAHNHRTDTAAQFLRAAALVAVTMAACAGAAWLADRRTAGDPRRRPDLGDLLPVWRRCAPAFALALGASVSLLFLLRLVLDGFGLRSLGEVVGRIPSSTGTEVIAAIGSIGTLVAAGVVSLRGWRIAGLLLAAFGSMYAASAVLSLVEVFIDADDMLALISAAATVLAAWLAVRRRLGAESQLALAGVLLLGIGYEYRSWINEPLAQLFSLSSVSGALLVGLLWRILTDNGYTRADSLRFPQPSRVQLALANAIVGVTSVAQVALLGGRSALDLSQIENIGDRQIGLPLVLAVAFAGLSLAARGRTVNRRVTESASPARQS